MVTERFNAWKDNRRGIVNVWKREVGINIANRTLDYSVSYSDTTMRRLSLERTLIRHVGAVNSLQFSTTGSRLISGSDDQRCVLWNLREENDVDFSIHTGHTSDILNVQFMPCSNDNSIVTAAADGQVRHIDLTVGATLRVLVENLGKVHKMAIVPGKPNMLYACSTNGFVTQFDLRTRDPTMLFRINNNPTSHIELYDIANDPTNTEIFAVAGSDVYTRIYDIRMGSDNHSTASTSMVDQVSPNQLSPNAQGISSLAYSNKGELLASYRHSNIYLFSKEEVKSGLNPSGIYEQKVYRGHRNEVDVTIQRISFLGSHGEYVVSGSDSGHAIIWRKRDGNILRAIQGNSYALNCVEPHPERPVLATGGIDHHVKLWAPLPDAVEPNDYKEEIKSAFQWIDTSGLDAEYNEVMDMVDHISFMGINDAEHNAGSSDGDRENSSIDDDYIYMDSNADEEDDGDFMSEDEIE